MSDDFEKIQKEVKQNAKEAREKSEEVYGSGKRQAEDFASRARDSAYDVADTVRENVGTISSAAVLFGVIGFALGWACGQSSARSERYWR